MLRHRQKQNLCAFTSFIHVGCSDVRICNSKVVKEARKGFLVAIVFVKR